MTVAWRRFKGWACFETIYVKGICRWMRLSKRELLHNTRSRFYTREYNPAIPEWTFSNSLETLKINIRIKPTTASCSLFYPISTNWNWRNTPLKLGAFNRGFSGSWHGLLLILLFLSKDYRKATFRCFFSFLTAHPYLSKFFEKFILLAFYGLFRKLGDCFDGYYL